MSIHRPTPRERLTRAEALLWTLLYTAVVALIASRHELWRDEVRALNIACASESLSELRQNLRNEGHPALWYLLLQAGCHLTGSMRVLKVLSIAAASAAVFLFFCCAPFSRWHKALFAAGLFPLYEYSVVCRNYGIAMLLLFAVAVLHRRRFTRPLPLALALALLANSSAYALLLAFVIGAALVLEWWTAAPRVGSPLALAASALLLLLGGLCSLWIIYPDASTSVTDLHVMTAGRLLRALLLALLLPGHLFFTSLLRPAEPLSLQLLGYAGSALVSGGLFVVALGLLHRGRLAALLLVAAACFCLFSDLVYPASLRHLGLLYLFFLVLLWIQEASDLPGEPSGGRRRRGVLALLLLSQVVLAVYPVGADLFGAFSSSQRLGAYLRTQPALAGAVIIGEPDFLLEALPYYAPNRIYQPREDRYLLKVNFTSVNRQVLSLEDVMRAAARLRQATQRPIVIVLGHALRPEGPFQLPAGYKNAFTYSPASLQTFLSRTTALTRFEGAANDENYALYLWRDGAAR